MADTMDGQVTQVEEPSNKKAKMNEEDVSTEKPEQPPSTNGDTAEKPVVLGEDGNLGDKAEKPVMLDEDGKPLSKRAMKRLAKRANFAQWKMEKRAKEREKKKQKQKERAERGEVNTKPSKKEMKKNSMAKSECKVKVLIDSSFDEYMTEREINSHVLQMQHAYAANRRATNPLQFYVTSVAGPTESRLVSVGDYKGWDVNFHNEHFLDIFKKEDVVYLSSDSPNVLHTLKEDQVYIIGGLVDHNKHKGLCHKKAEEMGLSHARLPIEEYIQMQTRKVLACNHVFEILLRYTEIQDWEEAFFSVIPKRKGVKKNCENASPSHDLDDNSKTSQEAEGDDNEDKGCLDSEEEDGEKKEEEGDEKKEVPSGDSDKEEECHKEEVEGKT